MTCAIASRAQIRFGVSTTIDDHEITSADSLIATIRSYRPGDEVTLTYQRGDQEQTTTVTLESDGSST